MFGYLDSVDESRDDPSQGEISMVLRKLESEDSCYDSDYETPECNGHSDVSRQVSDTLSSEFLEYVTLENRQENVQRMSEILADPKYNSKVEFALKLGYTESMVQAVLMKLGVNLNQNEFLAELIKLSANTAYESLSDNDESSLADEIQEQNASTLRHIIIDGSNVAMSHGNKEFFSCKGIKICVDWFKNRRHKEITVFVPSWRKESSKPETPITDQEILLELERDRILVFTPSRQVKGRRLTCYDDRYILKLAVETDGIVVSNDNYRDLIQENPEFLKVVEERILMFSFVNDRYLLIIEISFFYKKIRFMPPDDPLGRNGPVLNKFLQKGLSTQDPIHPICPYNKKCTYGNKCKYYHPERGNQHKSVTEKLQEHAHKQLLDGKVRTAKSLDNSRIGGINCQRSLSRQGSFENTVTGKKWTIASHWNRLVNCHSENYEPNYRRRPSNVHNEDNIRQHNKLERQLTLNPSYDPRLLRMKTYTSSPVHSNITRHTSFEKQWNESNKDNHQNITRIPSAPTTSLSWSESTFISPSCNTSSNNLIPHSLLCTKPSVWSPVSVMNCYDTVVPTGSDSHNLNEDQRFQLYYHLASLFPKDQVKEALEMYPDETDPQKICAAILTLFPKSK